ncbi:hypothetical protein CA11_10620 [Gimesia maris]|nr:hypothetical protein CA11_10620 [Gimesia maris]
MNSEHDELPTEPSDESIREILAPLQELQPSSENKAEIRQLVAARLTESKHRQTSLSTLRNLTAHTLVALACTLLTGVGIGWMLRGIDRGPDPGATAQVDDPVSEKQETDSNGNENRMLVVADDSQPSFYVTETYLCGVGILSSSSGHLFQEK